MNASYLIHRKDCDLSKPDLSALIGEKAIGLLSLPLEWVPTFFILTSELFLYWTRNPQAEIFKEDALASTFTEINERLKEWKDFDYQNVIVRSSGVGETMEDRGDLESFICRNSFDSVTIGIQKVYECALELVNTTDLKGFAVIIQPYIKPNYSGHLSNERRISRNLNSWSVEQVNHTNNLIEQRNVEVSNVTIDLSNEIISCRSKSALLERLKQVGKYFYDRKERCHMEWVWDGATLWIVQKDSENSIKSGKPGDFWKTKEVAINIDGLKVLKHHSNCQVEWDKIADPIIFKTCNLPSVNFYVLEGASLINDVYQNGINELLSSDLKELSKYPFVIRTTLKKDEQGYQKMNLPRTDTVFNSEDAKKFIYETVAEFINQKKVSAQDFAFLIHHFILSKSCALGFATPGRNKVRIDSSWGLADGLAYNGYDSFDIDVYGTEIRKKIRGKHEYLDVDAKGNWIIRKAGADWDWKSSLDDDEAMGIADMCIRIVQELQRPAIIMFFINAPNSKIHRHILPWHVVAEIPEFDVASEVLFNRKRLSVTSKSDFEVIKNRINKGVFQSERITLYLKFEPTILRDTGFIKEIGQISIEQNFHIELEGSTLSHPYYILSKIGAKVRCVDVFKPKYAKQRFDKLVRDKIPEKITSHGETPTISKIPPKILIELLKAKAVEESLELNNAAETKQLTEEMSDVFEILTSLARVLEIPFSAIEELAKHKREERGGFEHGIYLRETEEIPITSKSKEEHRHDLKPTNFKARKVKVVNEKIIISLIPSIVKGETITIYVKELKKYLSIQYSEKEIFLFFEDEKLTGDPSQLRLFM